MPRAKRTKEAKRDLAQSWRYIAERNFDAAERWLDLIDAKMKLLARFPGLGQRRDELAAGLQSFPVGNYLVFYRRMKGGIEVIRVLHGAQDLRRFFERDR
jgi:toxin ParE1/3/4